MVQANQAVWGYLERRDPWYKGPPSLAITEHWNYHDTQGFLRRLLLHEPGPVAAALGQHAVGARGLWGER